MHGENIFDLPVISSEIDGYLSRTGWSNHQVGSPVPCWGDAVVGLRPAMARREEVLWKKLFLRRTPDKPE